MAKQGQHKDDINDPRKAKGHNNPRRSMTITTGPYKKKETYEKQALEHKDPYRVAQHAKNEWKDDTRRADTPGTRAGRPRSGRSGSDSNPSRRTRGS